MVYKNFKDYGELLAILKGRGLIINDESEVIDFFLKVHYYRLSVYFIPFQHPKNSDRKDIFKPNISFERIFNLYQFDQDLRNLIFIFLKDVELKLRAQISHIYTKKYGPFGYIENENSLKRNLRAKKDKNLFDEFIDQVNKTKARANESFIKHIKEKYNIDDLPLWALVEIISFGNLSKFFKLMQKDEQLEILKQFSLEKIKINIFENWLEVFSYIRNICAHHSKLWNRDFVLKFKLDADLKELNIRNDKVFCALSVICRFLKTSGFKQELIKLFGKYPDIDLKAMDFPQNWQDLACWNEI